MNSCSSRFLSFWISHPALFHGLGFLMGGAAHFYASPILLLPLSILWFPFFNKLKKSYPLLLVNGVILLTAYFYASTLYPIPSLSEGGLLGKAKIEVLSLTTQHSFFGERWICKGLVKEFLPFEKNHQLFKNIPCQINFSSKKIDPFSTYWIDGRLFEKEVGAYRFRPERKAKWIKVDATPSLASYRKEWKQKSAEWIASKIDDQESADFLAGLTTGEFNDEWMKANFNRFGLQHLLAISGFHFALLAAFFMFFLPFFLPLRLSHLLLIGLMAGYLFFLGPQPSILRAWMMSFLLSLGFILQRETSSLNLMGVSLVGTLAYDPLLITSLGFQLSFAVTASILLFHQNACTWIEELLPKRGLSDLLAMNLLNQKVYCLLVFLRQGLALTLAVNLFALPLTLYYFHYFPLMGLLYNLFFPFLVSLSISFLLMGLLTSFFPFFSSFIHWMNNGYTRFVLGLISHAPSQLDFRLETSSLSSELIVLYLTLLSVVGIWFKQTQIEKRDYPQK